MPEGRVIEGEVDLNRVVEELSGKAGEGMGAIVVFIGFVKGSVDGKRVERLDYEVYEPYTSQHLQRIAEEEMDEGVMDIRIYHRHGNLRPGEKTLYIVVAARGRRIAFEKARRVLERVKHEPPIFKLEHREDGDYWVFGDGMRLSREETLPEKRLE